MNKHLKDGDTGIDEKGRKYTVHFRTPWVVILIVMFLGFSFSAITEVDRMIWKSSSNDGIKIEGTVVERRAARRYNNNSPKFYPTVSFQDLENNARVIEVTNPSWRYDFEVGEKVTVLWRPESERIAIYTPFKRQLGLSIFFWIWRLSGWGLIIFGLVLLFKRLTYTARH